MKEIKFWKKSFLIVGGRLTKMNKGFIPENFYKKITQSLPICCADALVVNNGKFILAKRNYTPLKNHWWFPGGRLFLWESTASAVKRRMEKEFGIKKIKSIKFLGFGENRYYKNGYFNLPAHTINLAFLVEIDNSEAKKIKLDSQHSDYQWLKEIPKSIHSYIKEILKLGGFK